MLTIVTSDFHIDRARFLFEKEFPDIPMEFPASQTNLPEEELLKRKKHEERALAKLKQLDSDP